MPIYDYLCSACDHRADILHGINDPGPRYCPSCGAEDSMRKQFAAPAIHFKGSGWAKKDRGGSGAGTKAASRSSSDNGTSSDKGGSESTGPSGSSSGSSESSASSSPSGDAAGSTSSSSTD